MMRAFPVQNPPSVASACPIAAVTTSIFSICFQGEEKNHHRQHQDLTLENDKSTQNVVFVHTHRDTVMLCKTSPGTAKDTKRVAFIQYNTKFILLFQFHYLIERCDLTRVLQILTEVNGKAS